MRHRLFTINHIWCVRIHVPHQPETALPDSKGGVGEGVTPVQRAALLTLQSLSHKPQGKIGFCSDPTDAIKHRAGEIDKIAIDLGFWCGTSCQDFSPGVSLVRCVLGRRIRRRISNLEPPSFIAT